MSINPIDSKIKKKTEENLKDGDFSRIREIFTEELKNIELKIEKRIYDDIINWCAKRLISILIGAFITIGSVVCGLSYKFISEHNQIQTLKIENQNIRLEYNNKLQDCKIENKFNNLKKFRSN